MMVVKDEKLICGNDEEVFCKEVIKNVCGFFLFV